MIEAINMSCAPSQLKSLGVLEFFSVAAAVTAADAAVKAAGITLIEIRLGTGIGGKSFVTFTGDVSAVEASTKAAKQAVLGSAALVDAVVIPHPDKGLYSSLL